MDERRVVLGLGSNLGDRLGHLRAAAASLGHRGLRVERASRVRETEPVGPAQPTYLNAAVLLRTPASARRILEVALEVEAERGRVRPDVVRWGPRVLDVDVLWIEGEVFDEPGLAVPHPRLAERRFALEPLLELAPDARDPLTGAAYAHALAKLGEAESRGLAPPLEWWPAP